jgi:hypothetical protein
MKFAPYIPQSRWITFCSRNPQASSDISLRYRKLTRSLSRRSCSNIFSKTAGLYEYFPPYVVYLSEVTIRCDYIFSNPQASMNISRRMLRILSDEILFDRWRSDTWFQDCRPLWIRRTIRCQYMISRPQVSMNISCHMPHTCSPNRKRFQFYGKRNPARHQAKPYGGKDREIHQRSIK